MVLRRVSRARRRSGTGRPAARGWPRSPPYCGDGISSDEIAAPRRSESRFFSLPPRTPVARRSTPAKSASGMSSPDMSRPRDHIVALVQNPRARARTPRAVRASAAGPCAPPGPPDSADPTRFRYTLDGRPLADDTSARLLTTDGGQQYVADVDSTIHGTVPLPRLAREWDDKFPVPYEDTVSKVLRHSCNSRRYDENSS